MSQRPSAPIVAPLHSSVLHLPTTRLELSSIMQSRRTRTSPDSGADSELIFACAPIRRRSSNTNDSFVNS